MHELIKNLFILAIVLRLFGLMEEFLVPLYTLTYEKKVKRMKLLNCSNLFLFLATLAWMGITGTNWGVVILELIIIDQIRRWVIRMR